MYTIADLKQFDDDAMLVFRADSERELYDVDYWEPADGDTDRMKALAWTDAQ